MALITIIALSLTLIAAGVFKSAPSAKPLNAGQFVRLMKRGASSAYVATYAITNYAIFSSGSITVANIPPVPGVKVHTNVYGYSSSLESSYVFRGANGRIVQWIQNKTNVSACTNDPSPSGYKNLQCSRPSPDVPSNGYAEEGVGFIPMFLLNNFGSTGPSFSLSNFSKSTHPFGELRCLRQWQQGDTYRITTCINRNGLVTSRISRHGNKILGRIQLISLSYHPTAKDFVTLEKPTKAFILPPN